jgi:hypothetical protein
MDILPLHYHSRLRHGSGYEEVLVDDPIPFNLGVRGSLYVYGYFSSYNDVNLSDTAFKTGYEPFTLHKVIMLIKA